MANNMDLNAGVTTEYSNITTHSLQPAQQDSVNGQDETEWINEDWSTQWTMFNRIPKLKNAIMMKAVWNVGKGYTATTQTMVELARINGYGKQTFKQILFNMDMVRMIGGDAYAEIIRSEDGTKILNLKVLDPGRVKIIRDSTGMIKRYELIDSNGANPIKFEPRNIFHMSYNYVADQAHGISVIKSLEKQILADDKLFDNIDKIVKFQATPFIIFKLRTDDTAKIAAFKTKLKTIRTDTEDLVIPDDENLVSWQVVEVNPSSIILEWRSELRNEFYRAVGLPQIIPGQGGQGTESDGKVIYTAFEQIVEHDQLDWEEAIWMQLSRRINLIHPASLLKEMQEDQAKDANQGLDAQEGIVR